MAGPIDPSIFHDHHFDPLLTLQVAPEAFEQAGAVFSRGADDLDSYMMTAIAMSDGFPFVLMQYDNSRNTGLELFVIRDTVSTDSIRAFVSKAAQELEIEEALFQYRAVPKDQAKLTVLFEQPDDRTFHSRPEVYGRNLLLPVHLTLAAKCHIHVFEGH